MQQRVIRLILGAEIEITEKGCLQKRRLGVLRRVAMSPAGRRITVNDSLQRRIGPKPESENSNYRKSTEKKEDENLTPFRCQR